MTAYCDPDDLLVGDVSVDPLELDKFINSAYEDITASLGHVYVTPIDSSSLEEHVQLLLKKINVLIASGRFLMSRSMDRDETDPYATSLLREGRGLLKQIETGQLLLSGVTRTVGAAEGNAPTITNHDARSAVDTFYGETGSYRDVWRPGSLV